jgi:hypothetical protein
MARIALQSCGAPLACIPTEHHVFRAAVLSIVLTMAAGPTASLLCAGMCNPHEPATTGCHNPAAAMRANLRGEDSCLHVVLGTIPQTRDDVGRWAAPSGDLLSVNPPVPMTVRQDAGPAPGVADSPPPSAVRPRVTNLRI